MLGRGSRGQIQRAMAGQDHRDGPRPGQCVGPSSAWPMAGQARAVARRKTAASLGQGLTAWGAGVGPQGGQGR